MSDLTDKLYRLISSEEVPLKEAIVALASVQYHLLTAPGTLPAAKTEPPPPEPTVPIKARSIKYDSMYDPAPPFNVEPVPPRIETASRVLAAKNTACICNGCKKVVYITNTDVLDGMKVVDFIAAYTPTADMKPLDRTAEIQNLDGSISTDCPFCHASKQLYLTGGPRA